MADSIPVTIVTGFLGSGKTTLLKGILAGKHGYRIAGLDNCVATGAELIVGGL